MEDARARHVRSAMRHSGGRGRQRQRNHAGLAFGSVAEQAVERIAERVAGRALLLTLELQSPLGRKAPDTCVY